MGKELSEADKERIAQAAVASGALTVTGIPQQLANRGSRVALNFLDGRKDALTDADLKRYSNKYGLPVTRASSPRGASFKARVGPSGVLPETGSIEIGSKRGKGAFFHELGHYRDAQSGKMKIKVPGQRIRNTLRTLRNEGMANIHAIKMRGLRQIPTSAASYGTYLSGAAYRHRNLLAPVAAAGAGATTYGYIRNKDKIRSKINQAKKRLTKRASSGEIDYTTFALHNISNHYLMENYHD